MVRENKKELRPEKQLFALGKNGTMLCNGIDISRYGSKEYSWISLQPINSKNDIGKCYIMIPIEKIDEIINALKLIKGKVASQKVMYEEVTK